MTSKESMLTKTKQDSDAVNIIPTLLNLPCIFVDLLTPDDKRLLRMVSSTILKALNMQVPSLITWEQFLEMLPSLNLKNNPRKFRVKADFSSHGLTHIDHQYIQDRLVTIIVNRIHLDRRRVEMYGYLEAPALIMEDGPCPWDPDHFYKWNYIRWVQGWIVVDETNSEIGDFGPCFAPAFYKAGCDYRAYYGDDGKSILRYPIYVNHALNFDHQKELCDMSLKIHNQRQDIQTNGVNYDIIDPNLCMLPLETPTLDTDLQQVQIVQSNEEKALIHPFMMNSKFKQIKRLYQSGSRRLNKCMADFMSRLPSQKLLREQFHWVPTDVVVDKNGNVTFCSPIHQLPSSNSELSGVLERLLERMVPLFRRIGCFLPGREKWQVVTKIQCYNLKPGQEYDGHWHREGLVENVISAGVYYADVSPHLEGGMVAFFPNDAPADRYFSTRYTQVSVKPSTDTALVFSNTLPHRHCKIFNGTDKDQQRLFVNFFVIDPDLPLTSTASFQAPDIPSAEHLLQREKLRQEMSQRNEWGELYWGNNATLVFRSALEDYDPNEFEPVNDVFQFRDTDGGY